MKRPYLYRINLELLLILILILTCLGCAAKQAQIPPSTKDIVKEYQSIKVVADGRWSRTDFSVNRGDYVLILASGRVKLGKLRTTLPPYGSLFMKIGKKGDTRFAVDPGNWQFFRSTETGRVAFRIGSPDIAYSSDVKKAKSLYASMSGRLQVGIFVFKEPDEERIFQALNEIARSNPANDTLKNGLRNITGQLQQSKSLSSATPGQTGEIQSGARAEVMNQKSKSKVLVTPKDDMRRSHTIFQAGHKSTVRSVAFSPNGKYILSGGEDKTVRLWEVYTGREIRVFEGHTDAVTSVAFSHNSRFVLSGSKDTTIRLWEVTTGREVRIFEGHEEAINSVSYGPNGNYILSGGDDRTVRLWDVSTGKELRVLEGHELPVNSVCFSPGGEYLLSGSWDGTLRLWDAKTGRKNRILKGHRSSVNAVAFSPDGEYVLSGSDDNTLKIWKASNGRKRRTYKGHKFGVACVAFSPDGKYAASGSYDYTIRLWEVKTGREVLLLKGHKESVRSIAFSPDGRFILSSSNDKSLRLWEVDTGREIRVFEGHRKSIRSVAFSPDGKFVLTGSDDNSLRLWEVSTGREITSFEGHEGSVNTASYSPDGRYIISGGDDKTLRLWEVSKGREIRTFKGHRGSVNSVAFNPNGKYVLSGDDKTLRLWEVSTGREIRVLELYFHAAGSVFFSSDGRYMISRSNESFRLWEVSTGKEVRFVGGIAEELFGSVTSLAISPDGRYIICGSADNEILMWRVSPETGTRSSQRFFRGHTGSVNTVAFSPDGRYVLSGSEDRSLRLWDVSTGKLIRLLNGHKDTVNSVAFSPDGKFAISGGEDCSARLWSVQSGQEIVSFHYSKEGEWMLITPDGYYTCSPEGKTLLYWVYPAAMETFTFEQFESRFRRPDIIKARLAGDLRAGKPAPKMSVPPQIEMADHLAIRATNSNSYSLSLAASALREVKEVGIFVNGKPTLEIPIDANKKQLTLEVPLFSGVNRITAVAYDEKGFSSNPKYVDVICNDPSAAKPNLYVLAIGVSKYPRIPSGWQLEFAHTDAQALIRAFKHQEGGLFGEVRYNFLSNEKATVDNILEAFDALGGISANDVAVIFLAGHGVRTQDGKFYFLTTSGSLNDPQNGGVNWTLLGKYLERIKGRVILLLDACHSGSIVTETVVPNDELAQEFFSGKHGGVMVFSASKGRQFSLESPDLGGGFGIFTYALVQGLGSEAKDVDTSGNGFVEFMELVNYVRAYVDRITRGEQTPWLSRKELFGDLPLAVVNQ